VFNGILGQVVVPGNAIMAQECEEAFAVSQESLL
jgi:hypothetical protein